MVADALAFCCWNFRARSQDITFQLLAPTLRFLRERPWIWPWKSRVTKLRSVMLLLRHNQSFVTCHKLSCIALTQTICTITPVWRAYLRHGRWLRIYSWTCNPLGWGLGNMPPWFNGYVMRLIARCFPREFSELHRSANICNKHVYSMVTANKSEVKSVHETRMSNMN